MSETAVEEGSSKPIDTRTPSTSAKDSGDTAVDIEQISEGRRLVTAIRNALFGEGVQMVHYPGGDGRDGDVRFVTLKGKSDGVQVHLQSNEREQVQGYPKRPNFIQAIWLDKDKRQGGCVQFIDQRDGWQAEGYIEDNVPDAYFTDWDKCGGADFFIGGRYMNVQEIAELADQIESPSPDPKMTEKAAKHFQSEWKAQRLDAPVPQPPQQPVEGTKAIAS